MMGFKVFLPIGIDQSAAFTQTDRSGNHLLDFLELFLRDFAVRQPALGDLQRRFSSVVPSGVSIKEAWWVAASVRGTLSKMKMPINMTSIIRSGKIQKPLIQKSCHGPIIFYLPGDYLAPIISLMAFLVLLLVTRLETDLGVPDDAIDTSVAKCDIERAAELAVAIVEHDLGLKLSGGQ